MPERIQKLLSRAGIASRRKIEEWIREGRIRVNDRVAQLGDHAEDTDQIYLDGRLLKKNELSTAKQRIILYHKPEGEVCTRDDPEGRPTIYDNLPKLRNGRWISIGRLDVNTSGLLLLTTDGDLAHRLMHPSFTVEREYAVRILGPVSPEVLQNLQDGVELEDGMARFDSILDAGGAGVNHWYHVVLHEGRNREVRRLWESQGVTVSRLMRIRFGPATLPRALRVGRWMELEGPEAQALLDAVGVKSTIDEKPQVRKKKVPRTSKWPTTGKRSSRPRS